MTERDSMFALTAKLYLQKKALGRKVRDAAFEAIRTIAAGCSDPAGRAQSVLELEAWLEELSPGASATNSRRHEFPSEAVRYSRP